MATLARVIPALLISYGAKTVSQCRQNIIDGGFPFPGETVCVIACRDGKWTATEHIPQVQVLKNLHRLKNDDFLYDGEVPRA